MTSKPSDMSDASWSIATQMLRVVNKMQATEEQLRDKNYSNDKLIEMCASALVAGEELKANLYAVGRMLTDPAEIDLLISVLARVKNGDGNILAVVEADVAAGGPQVKTLQALKAALLGVAGDSRSHVARNAAKARHGGGLKSDAKKFVHQCWIDWRSGATEYKTAVAFAEDMRDKHPAELTSTRVITGWVTGWDRART